jgi:excisionase family DNA binding protein
MASKAIQIQQEFLSAAVAAKRVGIRPRQLNELAAQGRIRRERREDPHLRRQVWMYRPADVARLAAERTPAAVARLPVAQSPPDRPWLTLAEASAHSGLSARLLYRLISEGRLPALDEGTRGAGRWRVRRADLDALEGVRVSV